MTLGAHWCSPEALGRTELVRWGAGRPGHRPLLVQVGGDVGLDTHGTKGMTDAEGGDLLMD